MGTSSQLHRCACCWIIEEKCSYARTVGQCWSIFRGSHPLSIQWNYVRYSTAEHQQNVPREVSTVRLSICNAVEYETHFHLRVSGVHCLFAQILLPTKGLTIAELNKIGYHRFWSNSSVVWSILRSLTSGKITHFTVGLTTNLLRP